MATCVPLYQLKPMKKYSIPAVKILRTEMKSQLLATSAMTIGSDAIGIDGSVPGGNNPGTAL